MDKLILTGITKQFGDNTVVDQLNLSLRSGEFVSLLGPSGCGKTTTLRMVAGFVEPTAGSITLDGRELSGLPPEKRGMSMIFQSYALWPNMTVEQNVAFGLKMRKVEKTEAKRRVGEILDTVQLGALARRLPSELSGGQQQRVSLARALVVKPDVLLLDGPRWRGRRSSSRRRYCSTSRCPTSMPTCAKRCAARSAGCTTSSESPRSTSRTIRRRR